jgi:hypothetical protein
MATGIIARMQASWVQADTPADLKQFEPAGYPQDPKGGYADLGLEPLKDVPTIACASTSRICRATSEPFGGLSAEIDADAPTTVVLRRFYYPFWRLDPAVPIAATDPLRLVAFTAPPGHHTYRLQRAASSEERIGWTISGLSLVLLLAWAAMAWRGVRFT